MKTIIWLILVTLLFTSCDICKRITRIAPRCPEFSQIDSFYIYENTETTIDDLISHTEPDSAFWDLLFKCDSNYNVLLAEFSSTNTGVESEIIYKPVIKYIKDKEGVQAMRLSLSVYIDSVAIRDRTIKELRTRLEKQSTVVQLPPEKFTPRWVKTLAWIGVICILLVVLYILYKVFKPKLPFIK